MDKAHFVATSPTLELSKVSHVDLAKFDEGRLVGWDARTKHK